MALILPSPVPRPIAPRCAAAVGSPQRNAHTCRDRSGRTARARAGIGARARRVARRRAARGLRAGHRGRRRDREVALARIGPRSRGPARLPRALGPGHRARAGLPLRRRAPAVRAAGGRGRRGRARPLAERVPRRWPARSSPAHPAQIPGATPPAAGGADPAYAWQHGLYWLASNLSSDAPLVLAVDDLQWIDRPSARALAFIARRLEGQPLALVLATPPAGSRRDAGVRRAAHRPRHAGAAPIAAHAHGGRRGHRRPARSRAARPLHRGLPGGDRRQPVPRRRAARRGRRLRAGAHRAAAGDLAALVPRGVANTVLLRLSRQSPAAASLARAVSVLGDGAQVGDAARLAGLAGADLEAAMASLVFSGILESGGTVRFIHPILRTAIYGDLSPAERERLHRDASRVLAERGAPAGRWPRRRCTPTPPPIPRWWRCCARPRARRWPWAMPSAPPRCWPARSTSRRRPADRTAVVLELGQAHARAGAPEAVAPLTEIVSEASDPDMIAAAAIELSGMLFFAGRADEGAAILRPRAGQRCRPPARPASGSKSRCWASATPRPRPVAPRRRRSPRSKTPAARPAACSRPPPSPRWPWTR